MFMNTIAVGPLEPEVAFVADGATVALLRLHCEACGRKADVAGETDVTRVHARERGARNAIAKGLRM